jgi:hypothetical protein
MTIQRTTKIALIANGVAHGLGTVGFAFGIDPHAANEPVMARRAAAAGVAAVVMFLFVSRRVLQEPRMIVMPIAFVVCNLLDSLLELVRTGDVSFAGPLVFETIFLVIYVTFAAKVGVGEPSPKA